MVVCRWRRGTARTRGRAVGWTVGLAIAMGLVGCQTSQAPSPRQSQGQEAEQQPKSQATQPQGTQPEGAPNAPPQISSPPASSPAASPETETASPAAQASSPEPAQPIQIDETVCGAGGQEAYFETPKQEIYICRNEQQMLTYIATPKQAGNSIFLPAQRIEQGKAVGYVALDEHKTYVVAEQGYQLKENNKVLLSERVTRRKLSNP